MYYITICDDDKIYIDYLKEIILESGVDKEEVLFYEYESGENFLNDISNLKKCDLLILDMQMKTLDGHETALQFRKQFPKTTLVFCSGVCKPTDESFKTTPYRYLYKSYSRKTMIKEMQAVVKEMKVKQEIPYIVGSYYYNTVRFEPDDIMYIENFRYGSIIHPYKDAVEYEFEEKHDITTKKKLAELFEVLHPYGFEYAHGSYIVNMKYVIKMPSIGEIKLKDGTILSVARSKLKTFRAAFSEWLSYKY